jgi:zinc/manganese transport system substrate-binding protein
MNFKYFPIVTCLALLLLGQKALGGDKIRVLTTIPELAWVAKEIGGDRVDAKSLLKGTENPHHVDAVPEFIRLVADADMVCVVGLGLEVGYMPPVFARSGNSKVQPGGPGYCEAGKGITPLEKPIGPVDRSMGDVHPEGNPHFWLSPSALGASAIQVAETLSRLDPSQESVYKGRLADFQKKMNQLSDKVNAILKPLLTKTGLSNKPNVIEYHKEFTYFFAHYGMSSLGSIEEKPGVPPSAARIAQVAQQTKSGNIRLALATDYNPDAVLVKFRDLAGIPVLKVPTMIRPGRGISSYEDLQLDIARQIASSLSGEPK